jgi:hypothetical protein
MKRIFAVVLTILFAAGSAYAVDIETNGKFYVRGSYVSNNDGLQGGSSDAVSYGYYDSELDMNVDLIVSEATKIKLNFEAHDQDWMSGQTDGAAYSGTVTQNDDDSYSFDGADLDDNIEIKRLFSTHTFSTGTTLDLGLMTGYAFGTDFGDNANGAWRVKVVQPIAMGVVGFIAQKDAEVGKAQSTTEDAEKDDADTYYLFGDFNVADHKIMPLLIYSNNSFTVQDQDADGTKTMAIDLAAQGALGPLGYEAEVVYKNISTDVENTEDYSLYGVYANLWTEMGSTTVGGMLAYGSYDKDAGVGYGFGEDFTPTMFGADFATIGASDMDLSEYNAVTLIQLYGDFAMSEALSLFANGTYWMSNSEDNAWEDATGYEIDLGGAYKITENVTYDILAAYGQIEQDSGAADYGANDDTDAFYRLFHRFTINF